jgi:hypothetical protein
MCGAWEGVIMGRGAGATVDAAAATGATGATADDDEEEEEEAAADDDDDDDDDEEEFSAPPAPSSPAAAKGSRREVRAKGLATVMPTRPPPPATWRAAVRAILQEGWARERTCVSGEVEGRWRTRGRGGLT